MSKIHTTISDNIPFRRRVTPRGWVLFDAPCCTHQGHGRDTRTRGNFIFSPDGSIGYNCYNCGYKAVYKPGSALTKKFEDLMLWLGIDHSKIQEIKLELFQNKIDGIETSFETDLRFTTEFPEVDLPNNAERIENLSDETDPNFLDVMKYLSSRGRIVANYWDYYWSPDTKYAMNKRIIIPFLHHNKVVGWTARYYGSPPSGITRYHNSHIPENYLFNSDQINSYYD